MQGNAALIEIREAIPDDHDFVLETVDAALKPFYGGDHRAHAERVFQTHILGGKDQVGHFSSEQRMFILTENGIPAGMVHVVGKRQGTYKISPLIVAPEYRGRGGFGGLLLAYAERYAREQAARQIYCTVAEQNTLALQFFTRKGYTPAGRSASHYKPGITETMLYKLFRDREFEERFDRPHISVTSLEESHKAQVSELLLETLPRHFRGVDASWVDALFQGYERRSSHDINLKFKLIFVATDRTNTVLGVAGATPKKGEPIKLMPFIARSLPAFVAMLTDLPFVLKAYGRKIYVHITPSVEETIALQQMGWKLDAAMPAAYHDDQVTQQWSLEIEGDDFMRMMRLKQYYLELIRQGKKTLEVRVGYDSIKTIQPGERIRFASRTDAETIRVKDIRRYSTFEQMLEKEAPERIAPGKTKNEVLGLLKEIYPSDRERLGVVVMDIEVDRSPVKAQVQARSS